MVVDQDRNSLPEEQAGSQSIVKNEERDEQEDDHIVQSPISLQRQSQPHPQACQQFIKEENLAQTNQIFVCCVVVILVIIVIIFGLYQILIVNALQCFLNLEICLTTNIKYYLEQFGHESHKT